MPRFSAAATGRNTLDAMSYHVVRMVDYCVLATWHARRTLNQLP